MCTTIIGIMISPFLGLQQSQTVGPEELGTLGVGQERLQLLLWAGNIQWGDREENMFLNLESRKFLPL